MSTYVGGSLGHADGSGSNALFSGPQGLARDTLGNLFVSDYTTHLVRYVSTAGIVTSLAGLSATSGLIDGTGTKARFSNPRGLVTDTNGNAYVADYGNVAVRKVTPAGIVSTVFTLAASDFVGLAFSPSGKLYASEWGTNCISTITRTLFADQVVRPRGPCLLAEVPRLPDIRMD
jgi:sugar lactone lactonase YvrE